MADARRPELYQPIVFEKVDLVFCDVAQPDEVELFVRNCERFLKSGEFGMVAIKSRSIDVVKKPSEVYKESRQKLESKGFEILDFVL